jgi:hypothetical protein
VHKLKDGIRCGAVLRVEINEVNRLVVHVATEDVEVVAAAKHPHAGTV